MKSILEMFEYTEQNYKKNTVCTDVDNTLTYEQLGLTARAIGSYIHQKTERIHQPIVIFMNKSSKSIAALLGIVYSGNFYVMMDTDMPKDRQKLIFDNLCPAAVLTDEQAKEKMYENELPVLMYEDAKTAHIDLAELGKIKEKIVETDPLYVLYTSGSTGIPKGVVVSHRNVLAYSKWVVDTFDITKDTIFGNQTPFYFSMSVLDIFATLRSGATLCILPKQLFSFPLRLLEYMNEKKVNTIYWVPSALCIVANTRTLDYIELPELKKIMFAGEVMPMPQLNCWRAHMPDRFYANLYGPTETTDICAYYVVDREFGDEESLPIGYACDNCDLMVVDENGREVKEGEEGELCVRGPFVAMGYYNNAEKTQQAFIQNPKNFCYPEFVYKTGDLVRYGEKGELIYCGRKDFQIKHMGYRIELGEVESVAASLSRVERAVAVYDDKKDQIILICQGKLKEAELWTLLREKLLRYMQPSVCRIVKRLPMNANGKIDRAWLKQNYELL